MRRGAMLQVFPAFYKPVADQSAALCYHGSIHSERVFAMLPCQQSCPKHSPGCHKTCPEWRALQQHQSLQRQQKKAYLKYYTELCGVRSRQFSILAPIWR